MKKLIALTITLLIATIGLSQTQQGYVKTKGRMVNGKLVPGKGLKGATVSIKGRTAVVVNADDGAFSFPIPETQFRLDSVRKKGYQLVDMDACPKTYRYSSNPLYIVMETPEQQLEDKLNAERKIRRNLQNQLRKREDEIEALKENNKITAEEYRVALQKLYDDQENSEQLISTMAKRFSELDYDQMDEFYRQVSNCIESGELVKADSLLRSRGDIKNQVNSIIQRGEAIQKQKEQLQKAEAIQQADIEEAARRCYCFAETFFIQCQNDSAGYYLGLRANLDMTRVEWQCDAGTFFLNYLADYEKALSYYQHALLLSQQQSDLPNEWTAEAHKMLGCIYYCQGKYQKALDYFNASKSDYETAFGEDYYDLADVYTYMGNLFSSIGSYQKALFCLNKALEINIKQYGEIDTEVATCNSNLGVLYSKIGNYEEAAKYIATAMLIDTKLLDSDNPSLATDYNNVGQLYYLIYDFPHALEYYTKALNIFLKLFGENHPSVATIYNNLGNVYDATKDHEKAIELFNKALNISKKYLGEDNHTVGNYYNNLGSSYSSYGDYETALTYLDKALTIQINALGVDHPDVANTYMSIGATKYRQQDYETSYIYYNKAYLILKDILGEEHPLTHIAKVNKDDCLKIINGQ